MSPSEFLQQEVAARIKQADAKVRFWRPRAFGGHLGLAILGGIISLLAGFKDASPVPNWLPSAMAPFFLQENLILTLGIFVSTISAWQAFYNHRARWILNASAAERLRAFKTRLEYQLTSGHFSRDPSACDKAFEDFAAILVEAGRGELAAAEKGEDWSQVRHTPRHGCALLSNGRLKTATAS